MDISWRIRELISRSGLSQNEIAKRIGVTQPYISAVANGKKVPFEHIEALCKCLNISIAEFFAPFGKADDVPQPAHLRSLANYCIGLTPEDVDALLPVIKRFKEKNQPQSDSGNSGAISRRIAQNTDSDLEYEDQEDSDEEFTRKMVEGEAAAGLPINRPGDHTESVRVPARYSSDDYFVIRALGNSMEPKIHSGDYVIVHYDAPTQDGDLAFVQIDEGDSTECMIKKICFDGKTVKLISFNSGEYPVRIYRRDRIASCQPVECILPRAYAEAE